MLNGALAVFASLQSTDAGVLRIIKRENIKSNSLVDIAASARGRDSNTVTELILGLPGDSYDAHRKSLEDTTNAGLGVVRNYQLIMLKQSELNTPENRAKYGLSTKFRIMPRSFGAYEILGESVVSCETEEICVSSNTLTFEDHLRARSLDLAVEILHNGSPFLMYWKLCKLFELPWFKVIEDTHRVLLYSEAKPLFDEFQDWGKTHYFDSEYDLQVFVGEHIEDLKSRTDGTNEMSRAKAKAFFQYGHVIHKALVETIGNNISTIVSDFEYPEFSKFLEELFCVTELKRANILSPERTSTASLSYDFILLDRESHWKDLKLYKLPQNTNYYFSYTETQKALLSNYFELYGTASIDSLGRLLMRSRIIDMLACISTTALTNNDNSLQDNSPTTQDDKSSFFSYS
jgi:hypothetical protein